jgi:hypothetical protein
VGEAKVRMQGRCGVGSTLEDEYMLPQNSLSSTPPSEVVCVHNEEEWVPFWRRRRTAWEEAVGPAKESVRLRPVIEDLEEGTR